MQIKYVKTITHMNRLKHLPNNPFTHQGDSTFMNEKFYTLPKEKQIRIINAGYRVFSQNTYKKSPMNEIAAEAGISKSLLFHYFRNKMELYLFLWEEVSRLTQAYLKEYGAYDTSDFFEMLKRGLYAKCKIIECYPDLTIFTVKAFYETEPEIYKAIHDNYDKKRSLYSASALGLIDPDIFRPEIDFETMVREMYWTAEGYMMDAYKNGSIDADKLKKDFSKVIELWKTAYCKGEYL